MLRMSRASSFPVGLAVLVLSGACNGNLEDTGSDAPPLNQEDTDVEVIECDGTAPVLEEFVVESVLHIFEGPELPAIKVSGAATDVDSDLHTFGMVVWWDEVVDGSVDTTGAGKDTGPVILDRDPCTSAAGTLEYYLHVDDLEFDYSTTYEFAGVVYDAAEMRSDVVVADEPVLTLPAPS